MRPLKRAEEFRAVQRESTRAMDLLRKALFSLPLADAYSPVEGGFGKSPCPSGGGSGWGFLWDICHGSGTGYLGAGKVTDRRNSTLRWYLRHCRW
jgi:hypothetical protein